MGPGIYILSSFIHLILALALLVVALTWRACPSRVWLVLAAVVQVIVYALWCALDILQHVASVQVPHAAIGLMSLGSLALSLLVSLLLVVFAVVMRSQLAGIDPEADEEPFRLEDDEDLGSPRYPGGRL